MKDTLNVDIWSGDNKIDSKVRKNLLQIARDFIEFVKVKNLKIYDIVITGSMANFNWHQNSDIDLHIIFDFENFERHREFIKKYLQSKKAIWNYKHDIKIYGFNVEIYPEDKTEEHISSGIFSLAKNEWIVMPEKSMVAIDKSFILKKYQDKVNELFYIIDRHENKKNDSQTTLTKIDEFIEKLKESRKSGLSLNGEYSVENLVFKMLRNNGHIDRLHDIKQEIYNTDMSIENKQK